MSKDDLMKKWAPIFDSMGVTNSHWGNLSQLAENQSKQILEENTLTSDFGVSDSSIKEILKKISEEVLLAFNQAKIDEFPTLEQSVTDVYAR